MSVSEFAYPGNDRARPRRLAAPREDVSLWWCALDDDAETLPLLNAWLSPGEHARAQRYSRESLSRRYARGRAALRWILAQSLGVAPHRVPIERGDRGRPQLAGATGLDFNVSNTRNIALVGIVTTPGIRIGVDVEHEGRDLDHAGLAHKFLTPREQAAIGTANDDTHRRAFLRLWTCKEAMSKATGQALSAPLRALDVELEPRLRLLGGPPPYEPTNWQLEPVAAGEGYLATVALWRVPA